MALEKISENSLKIYELFENPYQKYGDHQAYFAIHTLNRLYLDFKETKNNKDIKRIKPFLSEFTVHPYLMLRDLNNKEESEIIKLIFNDINTNLFPDKNLTGDIIRKVEYPSIDFKFMKSMLNTITSERRDERFNDPAKAKKLFLSYADKQHIGMTLDELESYAQSYHRANDGGGLDCSDD